jgi:radical SAM family uncharacterized protein
MSTLWARVEPLLARVQKPARYIGCEDGAISPRHDKLPGGGTVAWLLAYPDTYEIGLPNQGLQILYEILNERDDAVAERTYAPWLDLAGELRRARVPLFSVDTHRPASEFDILAFNLSSELVYTNVLEMIDLAGIPLHTTERGPTDAIVIVGGHAAFNPEPLADFIDAAVLGEGEEVVAEITALVRDYKLAGRTSREAMLRELSKIPGVYVPSMYDVDYDGDRIVEIRPRFADVPATVDKRTVADLGDWPYPRQPFVPLTEVVHDRLSVEVFRGCTRGCRFCQAGMITRPVRERPAEQVRTMIRDGLRRSGYDEVTLTSLSTADFSDIEPVIRGVLADNRLPGGCGTDTLTVNLPSLRVDAFTVGLAGEVAGGRRSGLTFAPEAGSWRLRQVINKLITEEDLYGAVDSAYGQGWSRMKLYFLTGLPTETDDDTLGIAELARNCVAIGKRHTGRASVTVSLGGFVPKPHTPFQWFGQNTGAELQRKVDLVRDAVRRTKGSVQLVARSGSERGRRDRQPRRPPNRPRHRTRVARRRRVSGVGRALRARSLGAGDGRRGPVARLVRLPASRAARGAAVAAPDRRPAHRLPVGRLAGRARRLGRRGLPLDAVLRLRRLHGVRDRARRRLPGAAGRRQPGHRAGPRPWRRGARHAVAGTARDSAATGTARGSAVTGTARGSAVTGTARFRAA